VSTWHANGGLWVAKDRAPRQPPMGTRAWRVTRVQASVLQDVSARDALIMGVDKPDATNTGVYPGSALTVTTNHTPVSGATYRNLDIRNVVVMTGTANVTYRNCIFRGTATAPTGSNALVRAWTAHNRGHLFVDCTFLPQTPDPNWNGISGYGFTLLRCDISYVVDGVDPFNTSTAPDGPSDLLVQQSYIHDHAYWPNPPDTSHFDGSHSDSCQWQGTTGVRFLGNNIINLVAPQYAPTYYGTNTGNACFQIKPDAGNLGGGTIERNWLSGGQFGVIISNRTTTPARSITDVGSISYNRFGRDQRQQYSGGDTTGTIIMQASIGGTFVGNVYDDTGAPIIVRHNG
jgi:hypothetical protein